MSEKTYEVLEPVRIHRKSRDVGATVVAHPDHVADLVSSGVLREVGNADEDRSTSAGAQLEANTESGTTMDATQSGASAGREDAAQGSEGAAKPVTAPDVQAVSKPTKPAVKTRSAKPAAKRGAASKGRK
ncbi:hypothetical protein [Burkholderia sp.]|uniref:hypothetical protein n=1 Tax=Burkholderia sp. TaxID=36773 RepID=UPI0025C6E927|nr:hypothetical protein [Burkholderia sp.]MBS6360797.1 hypothetical protein [Burkholderia sp.]